ncbi:MAG: antitoxin VapB family protein [Halobacterium sp.]
MGTKQIRVDEDVYERLEAHKREGESFSDVIDRLTSDYTLLDFAEDAPGEYDADQHRDLVEASDAAGEEAARDILEQ